jgi:predicted ArsR family transcriptional regulator
VTEESQQDSTPSPEPDDPQRSAPGRAPQPLPDHPVRIALLDLLAETGTVTATGAAERLGHSSGLCSFHLRQLARHGLVEEAPHRGGRARPWRLRWDADAPDRPGSAAREFTTLARDLEDESHQRWLDRRERLPVEWQEDHSFSAVVHLSPAELADVAAGVRELLAAYQERDRNPAARPADAVAVAAVTRLFPLL